MLARPLLYKRLVLSRRNVRIIAMRKRWIEIMTRNWCIWVIRRAFRREKRLLQLRGPAYLSPVEPVIGGQFQLPLKSTSWYSIHVLYRSADRSVCTLYLPSSRAWIWVYNDILKRISKTMKGTGYLETITPIWLLPYPAISYHLSNPHDWWYFNIDVEKVIYYIRAAWRRWSCN